MEQWAVVGFPNLSADAARWIDQVRADFPALGYSAVAPHFTLIFPHEGDGDRLSAHIQRVAAHFQPINVVMRCCLPMPEAHNEQSYLFLVPDEGFSGIVKLHDQLYTGFWHDHLRLDLPFVPHITLGYTAERVACKSIADALNATRFVWRGRITTLTVLRLVDGAVVDEARFALRRAHP